MKQKSITNKKILVDLSSLSNLYQGLGQVAYSYGKYFEEKYKKDETDYSITLLMPKKMFGMFGDGFKYVDSTNWFIKHCKYLFGKYDVWHSIHQLSRFKPAFKDTKFILTIHDLNYLYELEDESFKKKKHRRLQRKIYRADEIVCISEFARTEVENNLNLNGKECKVIYNKVELLDDSFAKKPDVEIVTPYFFSIGVLLKKKNFHVLLDMMKLFPDKQLYIAGMSPKNDDELEYSINLKKRIQNERISNVQLIGAISHSEKIWMYQNCEAFVFPSLFEGFGMPVIEAMQFGKPVFSSTETSLKEIGNEFAYFWEDFDAERMKSVIESNMQNFNNNPGLIAKEIEYAKSYSTNTHFEEYEKIYKLLMK